jgi:tRNA 2-thiouridine synthesizing protein D
MPYRSTLAPIIATQGRPPIISLRLHYHKVTTYFGYFYHDGIYHAFDYSTPPDDERQLTTLWSDLAQHFNIDLVVCISAAQRRGLLHADEASRQGKQDNDLAAGFRISGLGQLVEATLVTDRLIVFG